MIVADASVAIAALLDHGRARELLGDRDVHVPHLIDSEVAQTIRRMVRVGDLTPDQGWTAFGAFPSLGVMRHGVFGMAERIWELRENVTAYDAAYVALAEEIECPLLTTDARLSRAPGLRCEVTVLPG